MVATMREDEEVVSGHEDSTGAGVIYAPLGGLELSPRPHTPVRASRSTIIVRDANRASGRGVAATSMSWGATQIAHRNNLDRIAIDSVTGVELGHSHGLACGVEESRADESKASLWGRSALHRHISIPTPPKEEAQAESAARRTRGGDRMRRGGWKCHLLASGSRGSDALRHHAPNTVGWGSYPPVKCGVLNGSAEAQESTKDRPVGVGIVVAVVVGLSMSALLC